MSSESGDNTTALTCRYRYALKCRYEWWHGDELSLLHLNNRYPMCTMTSTSKDGELMDQVLLWLGMKTSRGSTTRGAVTGLRGLIRILRKERRNPVFAVDGPTGPYRKIKPGVFELSRLAKIPIYTAGVAVDRAWQFPRAWNKTYLPKPFARIIISWHGPMSVESQNPREEGLAKQLELLFHNASQESSANL